MWTRCAPCCQNVLGLVDINDRIVGHFKAQGRRRHRQHRFDLRHEGGKGGPLTLASKWAVRGLSRGWRRNSGRTASGVIGRSARPRYKRTGAGGPAEQPNKLFAEDIAATIMNALAMPASCPLG